MASKIIFISTNSDEAGAPRHCELILSEIRNSHTVYFVTGEDGPVYRRLMASGVNCLLIPTLRNQISPIKDLFLIWTLLKIIKEINPQIIHLHSAKAGLIGRICGYLSNIPTIYTIHGFPWRGMPLLKRLVIISIEKVAAKIPDIHYILVSNEQLIDATNVLKLKRSNIEVIHNGIPDFESHSSKIHLHDNFLAILMAARVCAAKDHKTLLKAFAILDNYTRLILCGAGTNSPEFINLAREIVGEARFSQISFLGEINNVEDIMSEVDVFVLSSNFEALPISIIEAMRAGLPIVSTDVGGVPELVTPDCGFLFSVGDVVALSNYLKILSNYELRSKYGSAAKLRFLKDFSRDQMMKKLNK